MDYRTHLEKDKKLKRLIAGHEAFCVTRRKDIVYYLVVSIMSQQLSSKAAATIHGRFLDIYKGRIPSPEEIAATPVEVLRGVGLSGAKASYLHNVARFAIEQGFDRRKLHKMDNEEVIAYITQIKGVGRWTAEMLLMFALGREDVFSPDDIGIQNAMIFLYKLDNSDKKAFRSALLRISETWSPYRTYACLHLWHWKDNRPAAKKPARKK
ncbi:MAG TPA: DNA-3-methyladenine glycosylase 2 family protein [Puia sp.]|jgi:DNA-3-methyladenine glycosylase II